MKPTDGHYYMENIGEPPMGWECDVDGDTLTSTAFGEMTWNPLGYFEQLIPPDGERHLYFNATGGFSVVCTPCPPNPEPIVGTWRL